MTKITKSSFFLTIFVVSLIWFSITLMILMFHEDHIHRQYLRDNLKIQESLESRDHFKLVHNKQPLKVDAFVSPEVRRPLLKTPKMKSPPKNKVPSRFLHQQLQPPKQKFESRRLSNKSSVKEHVDAGLKFTETKLKKNNVNENPNVYVIPDSEWKRLQHLDVIASMDAPGEMGNAVRVNVTKLAPDERSQYDRLYKLNGFNQYVSDMISYHRRLADIRNPQCKAKLYPKDLPNTSVIICLHNEAWSVLLRTVHSILNRSPPNLIHEIILVDDFSDLAHLKKPLDDYMATLKKVKVLHTKKREGLVRARLLGYSITTGDTLTFLDSHVECFPGWLEPLLDRVHTDPTVAVAPLIPIISSDSFSSQKSVASLVAVGGFDIEKMTFNWNNIPRTQRQQRQNAADPQKSPTIAGGLFTISRDFFTKIGTYDEGMNIWGGENLEISFRVWMCGGSLEIHPCSAVAHIFRAVSPYKWGSTPIFETLRHNSVRVAEVWMDDYKDYYYGTLNFNLGNFGDISSRKELRKKLNCHSFDWYVKNVYPTIKLPKRALFVGELKSFLAPSVCMDSMGGGHSATIEVQGQPCHGGGGNQFFRLTADGRIERNSACLDFNSKNKTLHFIRCDGGSTQTWQFTKDQQIKLQLWDLCLELISNRRTLAMNNCEAIPKQQWAWTKKYI
ncbi:polypeptide N-acetylgalactosaminyltransferase [Mytilus galloprovincialis]|uniref:Polypeptide N-acetylgalactosaminyltransferase n=2 Tax=Mytilus galloprovincialis TaxID=29158 RepID=A0A8B6F8M6_MYTGA|nr:polypeptide N-acetylgalactosaminyltransferase [Mytilus galloprovincialis]